MTEQGIKITQQGGAYHLTGILNEYADLSALLEAKEPLRLDMRQVSRFNSIGIRNLLKFLQLWGAKAFSYEHAPSELIDQINMIPALLGTKQNGKVTSLFVPFGCNDCDYEEDILGQADAYVAAAKGAPLPERICPKCGGAMTVLTDSYFVFLQR